jgi:hypothetical protein
MMDGEQQEPIAEEAGEGQLRLRYEVIESDRSGYETDPDQHFPFGLATGAEQQVVPVPVRTPGPPLSESLRAGIRKFAESPTRMYAAAGVGLGILFGITVAAVSWHMSNPKGPYDLGPVISSGPGLKGRLFLEWDRQLKYRLSFEPSEPEQLAGFSLAAGNPPRPLSIGIQLQNAEGFVLCSKDILLKYDARRAAALAANNLEARAGAADVSGGQMASGIDFAQLDAQEVAREQGKDIFQDQVGPGGQIEAINVEGSLPCTAKAYQAASYWSVIPNFPSVAEQNDLRKLAEPPNKAHETSAASKKNVAKPAPKPSPFYIEGDDEWVGYDASGGMIETISGRRFLIDKTSGDSSALKGMDLPVAVHYRCDQAANCTVTRPGGAVLHTRLKR